MCFAAGVQRVERDCRHRPEIVCLGAVKLNTLKKNREFSFVYRRGKAVSAKHFTLIYTKSRYGGVRVGFSVSKKVGNSVVRNKTRRRLKEACRLLLPEVRGNYSIVFVARQSAASAEYRLLAEGMRHALKKAGVLE